MKSDPIMFLLFASLGAMGLIKAITSKEAFDGKPPSPIHRGIGVVVGAGLIVWGVHGALG